MTTITETNLTQQLDLSQFTILLPEDSIPQLVIYPTASDFPQPGKESRIYHAQDTHVQWLFDAAANTYRLMVETIDCGNF
jgi:hypothetical protein